MLAAIRNVSQGSRELRARPYNPDALAFEPMLGSGWLAFSKTLASKKRRCFSRLLVLLKLLDEFEVTGTH